MLWRWERKQRNICAGSIGSKERMEACNACLLWRPARATTAQRRVHRCVVARAPRGSGRQAPRQQGVRVAAKQAQLGGAAAPGGAQEAARAVVAGRRGQQKGAPGRAWLQDPSSRGCRAVGGQLHALAGAARGVGGHIGGAGLAVQRAQHHRFAGGGRAAAQGLHPPPLRLGTQLNAVAVFAARVVLGRGDARTRRGVPAPAGFDGGVGCMCWGVGRDVRTGVSSGAAPASQPAGAWQPPADWYLATHPAWNGSQPARPASGRRRGWAVAAQEPALLAGVGRALAAAPAGAEGAGGL